MQTTFSLKKTLHTYNKHDNHAKVKKVFKKYIERADTEACIQKN